MANQRLPNGHIDHIEGLWAWIASGPEGEGLIGAKLKGSDHMTPFIGPDKDKIESFRAVALEISFKIKREVRLVCFTGRKDIERWPVPEEEPWKPRDIVMKAEWHEPDK